MTHCNNTCPTRVFVSRAFPLVIILSTLFRVISSLRLQSCAHFSPTPLPFSSPLHRRPLVLPPFARFPPLAHRILPFPLPPPPPGPHTPPLPLVPGMRGTRVRQCIAARSPVHYASPAASTCYWCLSERPCDLPVGRGGETVIALSAFPPRPISFARLLDSRERQPAMRCSFC